MLRVENVVKDYGALRVLAGVSFRLGRGDRLGLVGRNGAGKSTLLRLLAGLESPDQGRLVCSPGVSVAYLSQDVHVAGEQTVHDAAMAGFADLLALQARQRELEAAIVAAQDEPDAVMPLVEEHGRLQEQFEQRGGYALEAEVGRVLAGLGFHQDDLSRPVGQLSGGWQMRVALARLLVQRPDVLLLDEPTNHLDLAATEWLEVFLLQYPGALILVSHDRYFLNAVAVRYLELEAGQVTEYQGSYADYVAARTQRRLAQQREYERQQALIARQREFIDRNRAGQRHAQAKSREKLLERLDRVERPREASEVRVRFPAAPRSDQEVAVLKGVAKSYGQRLVLSNVNLAVERGERIALVGPNGAGKSTLLRLLAQREPPSRGVARLGQRVVTAYYAQDQAAQLGRRGTVLDEVYGAAPGWSLVQVRALLGELRFSQEDAFKPVASLSGGERARVVLAKLMLQPSNLLILDEPTNHLDIATREATEEALAQYEGALIFATHDRYLVDRLATRVWEVANGGVRVYLGNYTAYRRRREAELRAQPPAAAPPVRPSSQPRPKPSGGRALERELSRVETQIDALERALGELEQRLAQPSACQDAAEIAELGLEYASRQAELDVLNRRWEELATAKEAHDAAARAGRQ